MICKTGYDSVLGRMINSESIRRDIKKYMIQNNNNVNLNVISSINYHPFFMLGCNIGESGINLFSHPITVSGVTNKNYIISDMRQIVTCKDSNLAFKIKNELEYTFNRNRLIMNLIWLNEYGVEKIMNSLLFSAVVFSNWIPLAITKRFGLDPMQKYNLSILSSLYYLHQFFDSVTFSENDKNLIVMQTVKITGARADQVYDLYSDDVDFHSLFGFCKVVVEKINAIRLKDFNHGVLYTIIANDWFGINQREILAVALEHPPTFTTLVNAVLTEKTYKNSPLAQLAERLSKQKKGEMYLHAYKSLIDEYSMPNTTAMEDLKFSEFD